MKKIKEIKKIIEALKKCDEKLLLSDISCNFNIGDLKNIIINAMLKQFSILEEGPLEEWQKNDVKIHYFKEWLEHLKNELEN